MTKKKICIIILATMLSLLMLTGIGFGLAYLIITRKNIVISFDENQTYQTFEGFGTSAAWNFRVLAQDFPEDVQNDVISLLYGDDGLNLDIFRYNLGDGSIELQDCTYDQDRKMESFFDASKYVDRSSFSDVNNYDFTKDADYISVMLKAFKIGDIKKLVIFTGSPHYLLTKNGKTHGTNAQENNLEEDSMKHTAIII